jgi:antitoxin component YwqK of YwqJK toxin-antitoxin module
MLNKMFCILFIALSISKISIASDTLNITDIEGKRQGWWIILNTKNQLVDCAPDKKVEEGRFKDGQRQGVWKTYNCAGKVKTEMSYVNDRKNGFAKVYYSDGGIMEEGIWQGNKWTGKYKFYYENGQLYYDFNYNEDGKREGQQKYFHENGKLMVEGTWHDSKESGLIKEYGKDGKLIAENSYNDGKVDESYVSPNLNKPEPEKPKEEVIKEEPKVEEKKIEAVKNVDIGMLSDGFHKTFDKKGRVNKEGEFKKGLLVEGKAYLYDGDKLYKTNFIKGGVVVKSELEKEFEKKK